MSSSSETPHRPFPWFTAFLVVATTGLSTLVFLLSRENRALKAQLEDKYAEALNASLHAGDTLEPIELTSAGGAQSKHEFSAHPATLVLVISTHCPHCEEAIPGWVRAITDAKCTIPILCIESDATAADQMKPTPAALPAYFARNSRDTWLKRLNMVPAALLVDRNAKVTHAWYGPPTPKERDNITDALLAATPSTPSK